MTRLLVAFFTLLLFFAAPAHAVDINDQGAAKLKTMFSDMLEKQKKEAEASGSTMETEGDLAVEQADTYYAVTLPELKVLNPEGGYVKIGMVAMNVTPTEKADEWKMSVAIPTPIIFTDKDNKEEIQINISSQRAGGVWSEELNNFSKLIANYKNITFGPAGRQAVASIGQVDILGSLTKNNENLWSGPTKFNIKDLKISGDKPNDSLSVNNVQIEASVEGFNAKKQQELVSKLQSEDGNIKSDSIILAFLETAGQGSDFKMSINGVKAQSPKTGNVSIDTLFMNSGFSQAEKGKINTNIEFGYNGLGTTSQTSMTPKQVKFDLALKNLPIEDIIQQAITLYEPGNREGAQRVAALQMMMTVPQMLSKSDMAILIKDTNLISDSYQVKVAADFAANPNSPLGFAGALNMNFDGLDETLNKLKEASVMASEEEKQKLFRSVGIFSMVQQKCPKSGSTYQCELSLTNDGKLLLNGEDASPLLMGGMGAAMDGASAQPPASQ